jgi:phage tail protein X
MIISGSRYADSTVATVVKDGSDVAVIVPSMQQPFSFNYTSHQLAQGERVDNLAYQYYGDPTVWWRIADANPGILFWDNLTAGTVIRIPVVR